MCKSSLEIGLVAGVSVGSTHTDGLALVSHNPKAFTGIHTDVIGCTAHCGCYKAFWCWSAHLLLIEQALWSVAPVLHSHVALYNPCLMHHKNWVPLHWVDSVASRCRQTLGSGTGLARPNSRQRLVLHSDNH
jgi:hypothetical protein